MKPHLSKTARRIAVVGALLVAAAVGIAWYRIAGAEEDTDNAYVNADIAQISALVSGPVAHVHVRDNQFVQQGVPLFDIDPRPYQVALDKARAKLGQALQSARESGAEVSAAGAEVARAQAALDNASGQLRRSNDLVARHFLSRQAADDALAQVRSGRAALAAVQARLEKARQAAAGGTAGSPDVLAARAEVAQAQLDLDHTKVSAPAAGWVSNFSLTPGSNVAPGAPLFALIVNNSFWVDANFKETQLSKIRPGQRAEVVVDMYSQHPFVGVVDSVSGGTGTAFSLLPPQNATGNWVKVTQRVPVKIRLSGVDAMHPLRVGATATVTVQLH